MIKNELKYILIILSAVFTLACKSYEEDLSLNFSDNAIFGNWADTVQLQPKGYVVYSLAFRPNGLFEVNIDKYGLYANQAKDSLSAYRHDVGNYVLSAKNIYFISNQFISWDLTANELPNSTVKDSTLFQSCTYKIEKNVLELKFIEIQNKEEIQVTHTYRKVRDVL
jgi:hypothetical protein